MSIACFRGEWLFWAVLSGIAMAVYVLGIPVTCLVLLWIGNTRRTLFYPGVDGTITPSAISANQRRMQEYLRNRNAYGSLYDQVCSIVVLHSCAVLPHRLS